MVDKIETNDENKGFDIAMFAGLAIGIAIGFLLAPQAGKQTRDALRENVLKVSRAADEIAAKLK